MVAKTIPYLGKIFTNIKTFTTTYPAKNGPWQMNPLSPIPMEFRGYINSSFVPIGLRAATIDLSTPAVYGVTSVGDNTNANEAPVNDFAFPYWTPNNLGRVQGFAFGGALVLSPILFDYPAILGVNTTIANLNFNTTFPLPVNISNTGAYLPGLVPNCPVPGGGLEMSYWINLTAYNVIGTGQALSSVAGGHAFDIGITNAFHTLYGLVAPDGLAYVTCNDPSSNANRTQLFTTDWVTNGAAIKYQVTFTNPVGLTVGDIDDYLTQHLNVVRILPTIGGWTIPSKQTITLDGVVYNGYVVYILPDYSGYYLILLTGVDATAAAWYSQIGENETKFDTTGALWMKNLNSGTTLFVSAGSVLRLLPVIPPMPLPDHTDRDPVVLLMKANPK